MKVSLHQLVHSDLRGVLDYYTQEAGPDLADRFLAEFEHLVNQISENPRRFSPVAKRLRRANVPTFPYHLLFRETKDGVRILVLRHHSRNPRTGRSRK